MNNKYKGRLLQSLLVLFFILFFTITVYAQDGTYTPVTGVSVSVSSATSVFDSTDHGTITVTAKGSDGWLFIPGSSTTTTIEIKNTGTSTATISFSINKTNVNSLKDAGNNDVGTSYSITLPGETSTTLTLTTGKNSTENKVELSGFTYIAAQETSQVTINFDSNLGSVTVGESAVTNGSTLEGVSLSDGIVLVATPNSNVTFLGWIDDSTHTKVDVSGTYTPAADITLRAIFVSATSEAWFLVGGEFYYNNLNEAGAKAATLANKTIVPIHDGTITSGTHVIPAGVKLLIPFSSGDSGDFGPTPNNYLSQEDIHAALEANSNDISKVCYAYRTLTVASGAVIECHGSINVNGQRQEDGQSFTNVVMGAHGKLVLGTENTDAPEKNESKLTAQLIIKPGGTLYAYGYITGTGMVQVDGPSGDLAGGVVHEILQMASWNGGTNASTWMTNADNAKKDETAPKDTLFLLSEYHVQNIEAPLKVNYGATHNVEVLLRVTIILSPTNIPKSTPFITTATSSSPGLFLLDTGAYVLRIYDVSADRMNYYLKGGKAEIGSISIDAAQDVSINSADYILPVTHNMTLVIDGATAKLDKKTALLPGAELIIKEGSTLTLTNHLYIFDLGSYTSSHFFNRAGFSATGYKSPNHCPVPYVATREGLSPKAAGAVTGVISGTLGDTDSYYLNIINIASSAKLEVNGTLDISGNGAICTSSGSNTDKVVIGTGTIKNLGTPAAPTILGGVTATSNITFGNGLGNIVGSGKLKAFADDTTYYGFYFDADDDGVEEYWWSTNEKSITLHCMADSTTEVKSWNIRLYDSFDLTAYHTDVACTTKATSSFTGSDLYYKAQAYIVRNSQNQYYELINDAISDSAADETVFVLDDVTLTAEISVPAGKDLVLDLNEKTVTYAGTVVTNAGTLSVINGTIVNTSTTAGYGISNSGTIELINEITIDSSYGGIYQSAGTITEIGGKDGNVTVTAAYYALYINGGTVGTIGGENATVSIIQETTDQGHTRCVTVQSGTINLIGGLNSNITIKQIFQSTTGKGVPYLFQVNGGKVNTIGGNGAVIKLIQNSNSSQDGYGLIMSSGSVGTIGGSNVKAVEVIARDYPLYLSGGTLSEVAAGSMFVALDSASTNAAVYAKSDTIIGTISGGYFTRLKCTDVSKVMGAHPSGAIIEGYTLSTDTFPVPASDGTVYPCYYLCAEELAIDTWAANVVLGNNLDMMFAFPQSAMTDWTGCYVKAVRIYADNRVAEEEVYPVDKWTDTTINGTAYYVVTYGGFAAKEMCDTISLMVCDANGNCISTIKTDSIQAYATRMLKIAEDSTNPNEYLKTVIVDMLNYGAACQTYFEYNEENLANAGLSASGTTEYPNVTPISHDGVTTWYGANLVTESNIQFALAFQGLSEGSSVTYSFTGHKNNVVTKTVTYGEMLGTNTDYPYIYIPELVVADANSVITVNVTTGETTETWSESVASYVARNGKPEAGDVFYAFLIFANSAKEYLHNK